MKYIIVLLVMILVSCEPQKTTNEVELNVGLNYNGQVGIMTNGVMVAPITQPIK